MTELALRVLIGQLPPHVRGGVQRLCDGLMAAVQVDRSEASVPFTERVEEVRGMLRTFRASKEAIEARTQSEMRGLRDTIARLLVALAYRLAGREAAEALGAVAGTPLVGSWVRGFVEAIQGLPLATRQRLEVDLNRGDRSLVLPACRNLLDRVVGYGDVTRYITASLDDGTARYVMTTVLTLLHVTMSFLEAPERGEQRLEQADVELLDALNAMAPQSVAEVRAMADMLTSLQIVPPEFLELFLAEMNPAASAEHAHAE